MRHSIVAAALLAAITSPAGAVVVFAENFDSPSFVGASLSSNDTSDRFGSTDYLFINSVAGWSFSGGAFLAQNSDTSDGALLLNEAPAGTLATRTISGLIAGNPYSLSLLVSGDNRPGQAYVFSASIAGSTLSLGGVDLAPGTNPGVTQTLFFVATAASETLTLSQSSITEASPIVDNIIIASVPETASWAMLIAGFGLVGAAARRRRCNTIAA